MDKKKTIFTKSQFRVPESEFNKPDNLPSWLDCEVRYSHGNANPLEEFIYNNEPAGEKDSREFRSGLISVIRYVKG